MCMKNFTILLFRKAISLMIVFLFAFSSICTAQVDNLTHPGAGPYATIQQAIDNVATVANDIITVAAGTYNESLNINKSIILKGAQADNCAATRAGSESIINCVNGIGINASNVTINGFTIQGQTATNSAPGFGYAVFMAPTNTGTQLVNNIIKNNVIGSSVSNGGATPSQVLISCNWFDNNNNPGPGSGAGIYTDEFVSGGVISNVLIDGNKFSGHIIDGGIDFSTSTALNASTGITITNNEFDGNRRAAFLYNVVSSSFSNNLISNSTSTDNPTTGEVRIYGGVNSLAISHNSFNAGAPHAIRISDDGGPINSNVTVFENSFVGYSSLNTAILINSGYPGGPLTATCNWWGSTDGALIAAQIFGSVAFTPWLSNGTDNSIAIGFQPVPNSCTGGIPKLATSINGVVVNANNDGTDDLGSFAACNTANNILFNAFTDQNSLADPNLKVYQTYSAVNVTVPFCNNCSAAMALFAGATGTAALVNPALPGTLTMRFRSWIDADINGIVDPTEYASDWIEYTITINTLPTVSFDITGNSVLNVNNGSADLSEQATVAVCNGGTYTVSNLVNSSSSNRYTVSVTPSGGGLLFNGSPAGNGDISAAQFTGAQGTYTISLSDPAIGGSVVQVITPYNDVNSSSTYDAGDCLGDPITITYTAYPVPKLLTTINGITVSNNSDGSDDAGSIAVCNSASNNLFFTQFIDNAGATPSSSVKVIQQFTLTNVTFGPVDGVFPIGVFSPAFDRNVSLVNTSINGTLVMKFRIFYDINGDDILNANECANDWVVYTVTVNPLPSVNAPTVTQPICAVPTGTIVVNATGVGTLEYSINGGANWFTTNTFSGLAPGSYNVSVRLQSNPGCITVYLNNPIVLNAATGCIECPLSQGYWKNHSSAWPASALPMMLGTSNTYTKQQLLTILNTPVKGDASLILAHQLIAAKLNIAAGAIAPAPVPATIIAADAAIGSSLIPMNIKSSTSLGKTMTSLASTLDSYNNGKLNPGCGSTLSMAQTSNGLLIDASPEGFVLEQNYPNPFNSATVIRFAIPAEATVNLAVYNNQGQLMAKLADGRMRAGNHQVRFEASKLAAGIYIYRLQTTDATGKVIMINKKMIISK